MHFFSSLIVCFVFLDIAQLNTHVYVPRILENALRSHGCAHQAKICSYALSTVD